MLRSNRRGAFLGALVLALLLAVSARGDTHNQLPPGFEQFAAELTAEEEAGLADVLNAPTLDPAVLAETMRGVPEGPTPQDLEAAAADGSFGPQEGIVESRMSPVRHLLVTENKWVDISSDGTKYRRVYAGSARDDRSRGVLVVLDTPWPLPDNELPVAQTIDTYATPDGPLRIVAVDGEVLNLESASGPPLVFSLEHRVLDHPPLCGSVRPDPGVIEANDHSLRTVTLSGATDPDGDAVALTVTTVTQDEPLNGVGDGNTNPDAARATAPNQVLVRAERAGPGDGRVYRISFTGDDGKGGRCAGTVTVSVPHDQRGAVDSGLVVNSFG